MVGGTDGGRVDGGALVAPALALVGGLLVVVGVWLVFVPAALMVAGLGVLAAMWDWSR